MTTITLKGSPIETNGSLPPVGSMAPNFVATKIDLSEIHLNDYLGKKIILNIFPSLDTPTCGMAMKHFNELSHRLPGAIILCISVDLPFAQKRFCLAEKLEQVIPLSVFRHPEFGQHYGVVITTGPVAGLLARAVVAIDEKGKIVHIEQVNELADEPHYEAILSAFEK